MSRSGEDERRVTVRSAAQVGGPRAIAARMATLFLASFPDTVRAMFGDRPPRPEAMTDFFTFVVRTEPEGVQLALAGDGIVGYAITLASMSRLSARAALTFAWVPWVVRFLGGRYGLSLGALPGIARSKVAFARSFRPSDRVAAQVLSLAGDPAWRGHGVARALLEGGLDYLRRQGAPRVKLEVLDDNTSACHLYETFGFRPVGEVPYGPRRWVIMIKELAAGPA